MHRPASDCSAQWLRPDGQECRTKVRISGDHLQLRLAEGKTRDFPIKSLRISARVGNIPRRITLPGHGLLILADNDWLDVALKTHRLTRSARTLSDLERRAAYWIAPLLAACILTLWFIFAYALPRFGDWAAPLISEEFLSDIGTSVYETLQEREWLQKSRLTPESQAEARRRFEQINQHFAEDPLPYRLSFHAMQLYGQPQANALALPDGRIIVTDLLIHRLSGDELSAVLAHEAAHIRERHGMRILLQTGALAVFGAWLTGDFSGTLGAIIAGRHYSRTFETQADCAAWRTLQALSLPTDSLSRALQKLSPPPASQNQTDQGNPPAHHLLTLFSTHPPTAARLNPEQNCHKE